MAASELLRPGVEVIQVFRTASPTFVRPTLAPCVVGPAFEIINILKTDGTINPKARYGVYGQQALAITESSFPDPRSNIDELDIVAGSVRPFLLAGGVLDELLTDPGDAFLCTSHGAAAAAMKTNVFVGSTGLVLDGLTVTLAVDVAAADTSEDVTVTFSGSGNLTSAQAAAQINTALGITLATVVGSGSTDRVQLTSPTAGATSSVTVRGGGSANATLGLGTSGNDWRVEGAGYRGQDDSDNDTLTPWIEFSRGTYYVGTTSTAFDATQTGLVNIDTGTFVAAMASAVTFGSSGTVPIAVGDYMFADGIRVKSGEVMKVESTRFKVGTINTALSTADSNGRYTTKVYDVAEVETILDDAPFAPGHVWFKASNLDWEDVEPTPYTILGSVAGTAATAAIVTGTGADASSGITLTGLTLDYVLVTDGETVEGTYTFTAGGSLADMPAVVAAIGTSIPGVTPSNASGQLRLTSAGTGRLQSITIGITGTANTLLGFSTSTAVTSTGADVSFSGLTGEVLEFTLDDNPHIFTTTFLTDSLDEAIDEINLVVGYDVASKGGSNNKLLLTSQLSGAASKVTIVDQDPAGAEATFGMTVTTAGTGRPYPDAYLDDASVLHIQPQILRNQVTGLPLDQLVNTGILYIQFEALRKDVSATAVVAGVLRLTDVETLTEVLDPITEDNPLALGLFLAMINAPNFEVKGLGIDEVTAAAPNGTSAAWARAAGLLEAEEVYAIAPLTQDETVHAMWATHVQVMSEPEQGGERIVFINKDMPERRNPTIALSGTQANSTASDNQLLLDANPASGLLAAGVNPGIAIPESSGVYIELEVEGEIRRYNISSVSGALANLRTTLTSNTDGFYSTTTLDEVVVNAAYALKVRGTSITVSGSNPARLDYALVADTVSDANASLGMRRGYSVFPDTVKAVIGGIEKSIEGFYACAAIVGMCAALPPQQGFTNFPVVGLTGVVGTEKFTKKQLNIMAGGGTYILIQDTQGGAVSCRHQLSTDTTSIETRELSITKVVDFTAKFLRTGVRKYIGTHTVNDQLLDTIGTTVHAMLQFLIELGVLNGAELNNIAQDAAQPDTVLVDVTLDVPYPCNYIRLTLVV